MFALKTSTNKHSIGTKTTPRFNGRLVLSKYPYAIVILHCQQVRLFAVK